MSMPPENCSDFFCETGLLSSHLPRFTPRHTQQQMAEAIEKTLQEKTQLVVEAGTGTGKTFAYLIPALLSGLKILISTGTKNLQDQLFHRDLPTLRKAFTKPIKTALLKGRANYLCRYRLEQQRTPARFITKSQLQELQIVQSWARHTSSGDLSELTQLPEDASILPQVTSTVDNCLNQDCPAFSDCFLMKARRAAQEADILIINHHLFFADFMLKQEGVGELLPDTDAVIFDEAHQLPEIASHFLGTSLSSRQLLTLIRDTEQEYLSVTQDTPQIKMACERVQLTLQNLRTAMGADYQRAPWTLLARNPAIKTAIDDVETELTFLQEQLAHLAQRTKGLENCWQRSLSLLTQFRLLTQTAPADQIHWFETYTHTFSISLTPMVVADQFREHLLQESKAWIFTSATLAVEQDFQHFVSSLGLEEAECLQLESPFNYAQQALIYLPKNMPDPQDPHYTNAIVEAAIPVLKAAQGRTFFLFTSHRALKIAANLLTGVLPYPLLIQGSMPKTKLLEQYQQLGNAVLLGTSSFWEGIDVRGDALSCVIIDKLPFAAPNDPILQARIQALRQQGRDPFFEHQLPQAVITLKQGIGRLIRDIHDRGILMICDPRLVSRAYGEIFLKSLPTMPRTRNLSDIETFFNTAESHENTCA